MLGQWRRGPGGGCNGAVPVSFGAMPAAIARLLSAPARTRFLPSLLRAGYSLVGKRAWTLLKRPVEVDIPSVGLMSLEPWDFLDARLFFFGVWEPVITRMMVGHMRAGAVAVDVGANVGYYSLLMSRGVGPGGRVYAVEPAPTIRSRLEKNVALNGATNIKVVPYGISDRTERRSFHLSQGNSGGSHFAEVTIQGNDGLELRPLDQIIATEDLSRVGLIKIDVEGMEQIVLGSIHNLLPRLAPDLAIFAEIRASTEMNEIIGKFRASGFKMIAIPNEYRMWRYAKGKYGAPQEVESLPAGQHDVVLVRGDGATQWQAAAPA
jgi:FkbM family methyltransferase